MATPFKYLEQKKQYYASNKSKILADKADYYERNKTKIRARQKTYKASNKEKLKSINLAWKYGISIAEYNQLFTDQNGNCAICGTNRKELPRDLYVDHDHSSGRVRGLLCLHCNSGLGYFKDNSAYLTKAISYLDKR